VVSDIHVDDETLLVTSGISRSVGAQFFRGAHKGRVCVRVFIGMNVRACCERLRYTVSFKKQTILRIVSMILRRSVVYRGRKNETAMSCFGLRSTLASDIYAYEMEDR
jgi:hypothetical protein